MGETERGDVAPRAPVSYWCARGHETPLVFAASLGLQAPERWDCQRCGLPAGRDPLDPPPPPRHDPYKTHLAYVKERRSEEEGTALLDEALAVLRRSRGEVA